MGQTTEQIETHIAQTRDILGANIQELEQKIKSATDWKHYFQKRPAALMGVAFGGGVLLAVLLGGERRSGSSRQSEQVSEAVTPRADRVKEQARDTWDNIKGALVGVAATRLSDFVSERLPGFREQFEKVKAKSPLA